MRGRVLLVGAGKMGTALLAGWLERGARAADIRVVEPAAEAREGASAMGVGAVAAPDELAPGYAPEVVLFAVKPQSMGAVAPAYAGFKERAFYLSIAAGKPTRYFESVFGADAAIVRTMPNTPAAVGRGMTVLFANARVTAAARALAEELLGAVGETAWVDDEGLLDAVTAVSGSGPAYVFHLIECLADAGASVGLPAELAARLARATVSGAGELAHRETATAETLRRNVTSPGGTTEAALEVLMSDDGLAALLRRAVAAAERRSRELAG